MVITHKPLYFSSDITKCGIFVRVNIYLPGCPFNVSDGQVFQYKGITYRISIMNTIQLTAVLLFNRKIQTHYLLVFNIPFS